MSESNFITKEMLDKIEKEDPNHENCPSCNALEEEANCNDCISCNEMNQVWENTNE